jgi:hypothetical protein
MSERITQLEAQLSDFDAATRRAALQGLLNVVKEGEFDLPEPRDISNMHCHTFFSYNGYGYSPTALAWLGRRIGLTAMGSVDFDVLDGVTEFLQACDLVRMRGAAGLETRVHVPEFGEREINSPGEPGIFYLMGVGFTQSEAPAGPARETLSRMRKSAEHRNRRMVSRLNPYLDPVKVDYDHDVLPLTPNGSATERHMLVAYDEIARDTFPREADLIAFWSEKLELEPDDVATLLEDVNALRGTIRSKLMKKGGVGYMAPGPDTFPRAREVNEMTVACGAIPCATWLDGTSEGEQAEEELLRLLIDQGVGLLNIIPDRNWNIPDPEERQEKVANLYEVVELAKRLDLPLIAGTEMNKYGQKKVDDFDSEALSPLRETFLEGAYFCYGHTMMTRALNQGYQSEWAQKHLTSRAARNEFYARIGQALKPGFDGLARLRKMGTAFTPDEMLEQL